MIFEIDKNYNHNEHATHYQSVVLTKQRLLQAKIRYFIRHGDTYPSGLELYFPTDNIQQAHGFTTVILIEDFLIHCAFSLKNFLEAMVDKTVHLIDATDRFGQFPYFQINEIFGSVNTENRFLHQLSQTQALYGNDILQNSYNAEFQHLPDLSNAMFAHPIYTLSIDPSVAFHHCLKEQSFSNTNIFLAIDFLNDQNKSQCLYNGYCSIGLFLRYPYYSYRDILLQISNKSIDLALDEDHKAYFWVENVLNQDYLPGTDGTNTAKDKPKGGAGQKPANAFYPLFGADGYFPTNLLDNVKQTASVTDATALNNVATVDTSQLQGTVHPKEAKVYIVHQNNQQSNNHDLNNDDFDSLFDPN